MSAGRTRRTLLAATGVALFCSLLVSVAVTTLRPVQMAWAEIERNRVIVGLAGRLADVGQASDREVVGAYTDLVVRLVDLESGDFVTRWDPLTYDPWDPAILGRDGVGIPEAADTARLGRRSRFAPVWLYPGDAGSRRWILPLRGQGMWAPMTAFVALAGDCNTIVDIAFHELGETPGIGDRVTRPEWRASWAGLTAYDAAGRQLITTPGDSTGKRLGFDAITGATVTVRAVADMVRYWLGEDAFGPFLAHCRAGEAAP